MQHNTSECRFDNSDSWVILSPIEQSIKRKIETVGVPLKDWDISIYRGVLTGCNEAFIIPSSKRQEILDNCIDENERKKTDALIRPILRGRDIKRYGYEWADRWLINTHNGIKEKNIPRIDIENYPAIKDHLDSYWEKIEARADQGDTPYNLRNCAYMDLFLQPKICWKAVGRNLAFALVESGVFLTAPASFISAGVHNKIILAYLCSSVGKYFIYKNSDTTGAGDIMLNIQSLVKYPVPTSACYNNSLISVIDNKDDYQIEKLIFKSYGFSKEEVESIQLSIR
ncbi:MAG: class I SAM-dependent DNA methyltransferase [Dysgonomonas mossii]|nr:class I SAM-dependent DNA methyltransferase [Dysgonomonas mossii]